MALCACCGRSFHYEDLDMEGFCPSCAEDAEPSEPDMKEDEIKDTIHEAMKHWKKIQDKHGKL